MGRKINSGQGLKKNRIKLCANLRLQTDFYSTFFGFNLPWDLGDIFKEVEQFSELLKTEAISV